MADLRDFTGKNKVFTGTSGERISLGNTSERVDTLGTIRFNTQTSLMEYYDGSSWKSIDSAPEVSSVSPTNFESGALPANLVITGSSFGVGTAVEFVGSTGTTYSPDSTTIDSGTQITCVVPTSITGTDEPYDVKVTKASGLSKTLNDAFNIDQAPEFSTPSGSLGTIPTRTSLNASGNLTNIVATDDESDSFTIATASSLPGTIALGTDGTWSGAATAPGSNTTYNITVTATDDGSNQSSRNYSFVVAAPSSTAALDFSQGTYPGSGNGISSGTNYVTNGSLSTISSSGSVAFWIKPTGTNDQSCVVTQGGNFWGNEYGWEIYLGGQHVEGFFGSKATNRLFWMSSANGGNYNGGTLAAMGSTLSIGTWYWCCVTKSSTSITWYLNGSSDGGGTISQGTISYQNGSTTWLGGGQQNGGVSNDGSGAGPMDGELDEIALWSNTLSSAEVSSLYSAMVNGFVDYKSSTGSYSSQGSLVWWQSGGENIVSSTSLADEQSGNNWTMGGGMTTSNLSTNTPT